MTRYAHLLTPARRALLQSALLAFAFVVVAALMSACGTSTYQPGALRPFQSNPDFEISDADIAQAYNARPQLPERVRVAYYTASPERSAEIQGMLKEIPTVEEVYEIPAWLVTGEHRYSRQDGPVWGQPPQPLSVKTLRLLAARAHADVLIVFDYGHRTTVQPNGLVALNVLLVPVFFTPFLDVTVESFADVFVMDVRNGYLYGHVAADEVTDEAWSTIYDAEGAPLVEEHWPKLLTATRDELTKVVKSTPDASASSATPVETAPSADASP